MNTPTPEPLLSFYVELYERDEERVKEDIADELAWTLAKFFKANQGRNCRLEILAFIQKDMWDNYGDKLRFTVLQPI